MINIKKICQVFINSPSLGEESKLIGDLKKKIITGVLLGCYAMHVDFFKINYSRLFVLSYTSHYKRCSVI